TSGKLQLSGTPASLQGQAEFHGRGLVLDGSAAWTADLDARLAFGVANFKAGALFRSSDPITAEGAVPLRLQKRDAGYGFATGGPLSATLDFPAVFLANLPHYLSAGVFTRGILSGKLTISDSVQQPLVTGNFNLIDGKLLGASSISAGATFQGRRGTIDYARIAQGNADISARGEIDFKDAAHIDVALTPNTPLDVAGLGSGECVSRLEFDAPRTDNILAVAVNRFDFRGGLFEPWTIQLTQQATPDSEAATKSLPFCREGKTLSLAVTQTWFP
ncbi:MAG TPA: hypothetical protein VF511_03220, partial [Chthoniobacterales bacterium]